MLLDPASPAIWRSDTPSMPCVAKSRSAASTSRRALAEGEAASAVVSGADVGPFELFAHSLFDGLAGFLAAPASEATMRRVRDAGDLGAGRLRVL